MFLMKSGGVDVFDVYGACHSEVNAVA